MFQRGYPDTYRGLSTASHNERPGSHILIPPDHCRRMVHDPLPRLWWLLLVSIFFEAPRLSAPTHSHNSNVWALEGVLKDHPKSGKLPVRPRGDPASTKTLQAHSLHSPSLSLSLYRTFHRKSSWPEADQEYFIPSSRHGMYL